MGFAPCSACVADTTKLNSVADTSFQRPEGPHNNNYVYAYRVLCQKAVHTPSDDHEG